MFCFYSVADTPFSQLKISEIGAWLGRRNKTPQAVVGAFSRAYWRWQHKYVQTRRVGVAPFFQFAFANMFIFYIFNYNRLSKSLQYQSLWIYTRFNCPNVTNVVVVVVISFYHLQSTTKTTNTIKLIAPRSAFVVFPIMCKSSNNNRWMDWRI